MRRRKIRHYLTGVALVVLVLAASGCKFMSVFNRHKELTPAELASLKPVTEMPKVTGKDLDASGRRLTAAGLTVMVKRQALVVNPKGEAGFISFTVPETVVPFEPSHWNHMIAAQDPPAGSPLPPGSQITLTAGIHHGAGPFRPWLDAHGGATGRIGEKRCRECHTTSYCSDCHDRGDDAKPYQERQVQAAIPRPGAGFLGKSPEGRAGVTLLPLFLLW